MIPLIDSQRTSFSSESVTDPFWKKLFPPGEFEWAFRMRQGDAGEFFAKQNDGVALLGAKGRSLDEHPDRYVAQMPGSEGLVEEVWQVALGLGQVEEPVDGERDLETLARLWEADLLVMESASKKVAAAAVSFPSSWDPAGAVGKTLDDVHGVVPRLNPQIGVMINRFLDKVPPGKSYCRENWSFTRTEELDYHPAVGRRRLDESVTLDELFLRVEHQLFTGIPGGVLMGIRIEVCPLKDLAADPEVWRTVAEKIRSMPADVAEYKSMDGAIERMLEEMEAFQETGEGRND
jgi:hypothetical protein